MDKNESYIQKCLRDSNLRPIYIMNTNACYGASSGGIKSIPPDRIEEYAKRLYETYHKD